MKQVLPPTHLSPETAYVVNDYPYGFRLRCKIRYWLEHNAKRGTRFVSQTTNPKRDGEVWNKPKASVYCEVAGAMFLDEKGHVQWSGIGYYAGAEEAKAWQAEFSSGLTPEVAAKVQHWVDLKVAYEAARAAGDSSYVASLVAQLATATKPELRAKFEELIAKRRELEKANPQN